MTDDNSNGTIAALCRDCKKRAPGNAAAMRAALESTEELLEHFATPGTMLGDAFAMHMRDNRAALAAPPRNCDRFADYAAARDAYHREQHGAGATPLGDWLFAAAKEDPWPA